ncbi:MAG TPA: TonB-dependent receptor [Candidatus Binataceae bacterium]|nr:TonB-dependent receptor [Candidatus Binataceae bacterium]
MRQVLCWLGAFWVFAIVTTVRVDAADSTEPATAVTVSAASPSTPVAVGAAAPAHVATKSPGTTPLSPTADANAKQSPAKLPAMTIVVTPTRLPEPLGQAGTTVSVVDAQEIETQQARSAIDALAQVPGVQVVQSGSPGTLAEVFIRGADPSQTLIMIDGVPVNDSATSSFDLSRLTTGDLNQIEVLRGAGGALYGSQAIGGVINLISREGSGPPQFSLLSEGGNSSSVNQVGTFSGAEGRLAYSGAVSYFSTNGFRPINDSSDNLAGALRLDYHLDENTTIRGFARYIRANVSLVSNSIASGIPLNPNAHQRNEFMLFKGEIDHQFSERLSTRLSAFYVRDELRENEVPFAGSPIEDTTHIPDETRGGNLDAVYQEPFGLRTLVGFDFLDRWVHSQDDFVSFAPPPLFRSLTVFNARRQEYAGYVEQEARLFKDHLILTGGFRVDGNSDFGKEVSPDWSVALPFNQYGLTLRANYAEGFRAPAFDELFFPGFGNPSLGPELSSEYDGGVTKTFGEKLSVTTTYFARRVHSDIVTVLCPFNAVSCPFGFTEGNVGRVDTQGVEFVPNWRPLKELDLSGSFTYLDQRHAPPLFSRTPVRVPKYSAAASAQYTHRDLILDHDRTAAAVIYNFVGDRNDFNNTGSIVNHAAYHLVDLAFSYSPGWHSRFIRDEQLVARIQNLLDRQYSQALGFPAPPLNFLAGVKLDFGAVNAAHPDAFR